MSEQKPADDQPVTRLFSYPYIVVDRAATNALEMLIHLAPKIGRQTWKPLSAGSGEHVIVTPGGARYIIVETYAASMTETIVSISFADKKNYENRRSLEIISQLLDFDLRYEQNRARELRQQQDIPEPVDMNQIEQQVRTMNTNTKRRGPEPKPYNAWARDQARNGRKLDDPGFVEEYMRQRGIDPADTNQRERAREALRKTIERDQKL